MSKRTLAWIAIAFVGLVAGAGVLWAMFGTSRISITESDIQAPLNQKLPMTVKELTIERVAVQLADNRLALRIDVQGTVLRQPISAAVSARGVPRYEARTGQLFFDADDVKVVQVTIGKKTVIGEADTQGRVAETVQRLAEAAIKAYLAARPVYQFRNDLKGIVAKAALSGVAIEQNNLVVTLSIWNLMVMVAIFGLALIVVLYLISLLIRHFRRGRATPDRGGG